MGDLKPISYEEALKKQQITKDSLAAIKPVETSDVKTETGSKYDRIKTKKTIQANEIDSTTCYRYGFADILADTAKSQYLTQFKSSGALFIILSHSFLITAPPAGIGLCW